MQGDKMHVLKLFVKINLRCKVEALKAILIMINNRLKEMNYLNWLKIKKKTGKDKWPKNIVRLNRSQELWGNKSIIYF